MKVQTLFFLFFMLIISSHAQETISEEQVLLNGYIDNSGKVLLTGYATPESVYYMFFLNSTQYTYDNETNQLYALTDMLTSKSGNIWLLNFSLDGYYSDYSVTFELPQGSEITGFETEPELNYQFQVKEDSLMLSFHGYRVVSPLIKVEYKLPVTVQEPSKNSVSTGIQVLIFIVFIAVIIFFLYISKKRLSIIEDGKSLESETEVITEKKSETKEIHITDGMHRVINTLSDKEKAIINLLLSKGGAATQADIRSDTGIPRSSLTGIINALKRKNIIKKREYGKTNIIELSEWFLSENEQK